MPYCVTEARVMEGYQSKASWIYEAGEIVDPETMPEGHFERLLAADVLRPVAAPEAAPLAAPVERPAAPRRKAAP